jgi:hypothetical protein
MSALSKQFKRFEKLESTIGNQKAAKTISRRETRRQQAGNKSPPT